MRCGAHLCGRVAPVPPGARPCSPGPPAPCPRSARALRGLRRQLVVRVPRRGQVEAPLLAAAAVEDVRRRDAARAPSECRAAGAAALAPRAPPLHGQLGVCLLPPLLPGPREVDPPPAHARDRHGVRRALPRRGAACGGVVLHAPPPQERRGFRCLPRGQPGLDRPQRSGPLPRQRAETASAKHRRPGSDGIPPHRIAFYQTAREVSVSIRSHI
mmetsp:Transcript_16483/g.39115  ORF Transcript_16483/g.39115 Transcript_16483/m.39115 type:complete len:214 (-) Transcript_16483:203-844(-)